MRQPYTYTGRLKKMTSEKGWARLTGRGSRDLPRPNIPVHLAPYPRPAF